MNIRQLIGASVLAVFGSIVAPPTQVAFAAAAPAIDADKITEHVRVLSADAFEGRAPASAGETKTVDYLIAQLKAAGLQPGGDLRGSGRAWTQDVPAISFKSGDDLIEPTFTQSAIRRAKYAGSSSPKTTMIPIGGRTNAITRASAPSTIS